MSRRKSAASKPKGAKADPKTNTATASSKVSSTPPRKPSAMEELVPRKTLTSLVRNVSALKMLPLKQYALRDPSAASLGVATVSVSTAIASETANPSTAVTPYKFGLSDKKHIMNEKGLVFVLATVVAKEFGYDRERRKLIQEQFDEYLPRLMKRSSGPTI